MDTPKICRADGCERRAVASVARDDLPDRVMLCATHTEDFRMNGERWVFIWDPVAAAPSSVTPAPLPAIGQAPPGSAGRPVVPALGANGEKSRLTTWIRRRS